MKKVFKLSFLLMAMFLLYSCSTVRVTADYDSKTNFKEYKTFAFYKTGIDKAQISDLDKRRIMRAIEAELLARGMTKSKDPDLLVSLFTKSRQRVDAYQHNNWGLYGYGYYGFGWGMYNPWMWGGLNNDMHVSQYTEGTLFVDLIDADKKELVWQGIGTGALRINNVEKKEARVKEFVSKIMENYPPKLDKK